MGRTSDARDRLLDSALELISSRSYNDVGVQELCRHSGVKKGSFYHFFESKRDLVLAVLDRQAEHQDEELRRLFESELEPLEKIRLFIDSAVQKNRECKGRRGSMAGCCFGNLAVEMSTLDVAIRDRLNQIFEQRVAYIRGALAEAIESGSLPKLDPDPLAHAFIAFLQGSVAMAKTRNDPELIAEMARAVEALVLGER